MPDDQHLKAIYDELFELATKGHDNFVEKLSVLLLKHNLNIAEMQSSSQEDLRQFELAFREKRYKQLIDNWHREFGSFPKLDIYREIKEDYRVEPYILYIRNKRHQQALARLRVSSHNLYIETGRHSRPFVPRHKRICNYCPLNEIDNEKHFLLKCTFHSVERRSLFKVVNSLLEKEKESSSLYLDLINGQFIALMRTKDPIVLGAFGKYIYEGFKKRDHLENNSWSSLLITTYLICQWIALNEPWLFCILKSFGLLLHGDIRQF